MENHHYCFENGRPHRATRTCIVGVVASGNLEVMIEPAALSGACTVEVATAAAGYGVVWNAVVADFLSRHALCDTRISINDNGATPAIVALRLAQAAEEFIAGADEAK